MAPGAFAGWAEETIRKLSPQQEWDRWRVYVAGRLGLSVDDLRKARLVLNPAHFAPRGANANVSRHVTPASCDTRSA